MQVGKVTSFIALMFIIAAIMYGISRARKVLPGIRRIAGLEAIEEAIGRATETDKPVFYTAGSHDITGEFAAVTFSSLEILGYTSRMVSRNKAKMTVGISQPNVYPLAMQIVEEGYIQGGNQDLFSPEIVQFQSPGQWASASNCMGFIEREQAAATLMLGHFLAEAMLIAESSAQVGAICISGMTAMAQLPFLVAACDYTLIGDEMLVAGAYLAQDPVKLGSTAGQDWVKLLSAGLILAGSILATFGNGLLVKLLDF